MIGGTVLETREQGDLTRLWVCGRGAELHDEETAILVRRAAAMPSVGDVVWWHGGLAFFTPWCNNLGLHPHPLTCAQGIHWDVPLERVGSAFDPLQQSARVGA